MTRRISSRRRSLLRLRLLVPSTYAEATDLHPLLESHRSASLSPTVSPSSISFGPLAMAKSNSARRAQASMSWEGLTPCSMAQCRISFAVASGTWRFKRTVGTSKSLGRPPRAETCSSGAKALTISTWKAAAPDFSAFGSRAGCQGPQCDGWKSSRALLEKRGSLNQVPS